MSRSFIENKNAIISEPTVSVILFVFNHARFLAKTLKSIEMQSLKNDFEIIIHDDASTDGSIDICERFQTESAHSVTIIKQTLNKVSRKISFWPEIIERCRGDLIAISDGDDFWTTPLKLENQCIALGVLPNVDLCFHRVVTVDHASEEVTGTLCDYGDEPKLFSTATVIEGDGGFMPTVSLMFRKSVLQNLPQWFFRPPTVEDYFLQIQGSLRGGAVYLPLWGGAHRKGDPNSWTQRTINDTKILSKFRIDLIANLLDLADTLPGHFLPNLEKVIMRYFFFICSDAMAQGQYNNVWRASQILNSRRIPFDGSDRFDT